MWYVAVSEAAYDEYEGLKERYEQETKRRSFAEKKVTEVSCCYLGHDSELILSAKPCPVKLSFKVSVINK